MGAWWAGKTRQFLRHVAGRVSSSERARVESWLTPDQLRLFDAMHRADRRHGLDVVQALRAQGHDEPDVLLAGLLHDSGKGRSVGLWHRVAWSLGERYGAGLRRAAARLPGFRRAFTVIETHAETSARLALAAGCSPRTADLIRRQGEPATDLLAEALRLADEAS